MDAVANTADGVEAAQAPEERLPVLVVCNRHSGRGTGWSLAEQLVDRLRQAGCEAVLRQTELDGSTFADATADRFRCAVIVGGDGSFHAAVNQLTDLELPLAFFGTGTINVLSLERQLPREPDAVARLVLAGKTAEVPLLRALGRRFVLFAEVGWLAGVVADVNAWRARAGKHGRLEFVRFGMARMMRSGGRPLRLRLWTPAGDVLERSCANVLMTRARIYGGSMKVPMLSPREQPLEDAAFTVVIQRGSSVIGHASYLTAGGLGLLRAKGRSAELCLATEVEVQGPERTPVHLDAESDGLEVRWPIRFGPDGSSIRLLVP